MDSEHRFSHVSRHNVPRNIPSSKNHESIEHRVIEMILAGVISQHRFLRTKAKGWVHRGLGNVFRWQLRVHVYAVELNSCEVSVGKLWGGAVHPRIVWKRIDEL